MAKAARAAGGAPLPEEIVVWEILVRLPPESLLRCQAVCRAWRLATSTRGFLLAHHAHQPALPVFFDTDQISGVHHQNIRVFDRRADNDKLHTVARLDEAFHLEASCDGLLIFSKSDSTSPSWTRDLRLSVCNPATREHASLVLPPWNLSIIGMYPHQPTGEYRLLLQQITTGSPEEQVCYYYVFALGSKSPPRLLEVEDTDFSWCINIPVRVRDSLHWYPGDCFGYDKQIVVFDTIAESLSRMRSPAPSTNEYIFDMNGTLGIYVRNYERKDIDVDPFLEEQDTLHIWVLRNYESEIWEFKCRIRLPLAEIRCDIKNKDYYYLDVVSRDDDVLVLLLIGRYLIHVDSHGKLLDKFGPHNIFMTRHRIKQCLVQHSFFPALEGYAVNASPWLPKPPSLQMSAQAS